MRHVRLLSEFCVLLLCMGCIGDLSQPSEKSQMDDFDARLDEDFRIFAETKDAEVLSRAWNSIEGLPMGDPKKAENWRAVRRKKLESWFRAFNYLDKELDPKFDPKDVPDLTVMPPSSETAVYDSGTSPEDIKDPEARRQYEEAIKKNSEKSKRYKVQKKLHKLDEQWSAQIDSFVTDNYRRAPEDKSELDHTIKIFLKARKRADRIKALTLQMPGA
jgi:hypothetical protein